MTRDSRVGSAPSLVRDVLTVRRPRVGLDDVLAGSPGVVDGPLGDLRRSVLEVALAGLAAADPGAATRRAVSYSPAKDTVTVEDRAYPLLPGARVLVLGAGKASHPIAEALHEILGDRIDAGVVVARDPSASSQGRIEVLCADHPLPSPRSAEAAARILALAGSARDGDLVLLCFTGGSSALASLPSDGVTQAEKSELHQLLLSSGMPIVDINVVRKQVSRIKGGRVALAAGAAQLVNLTVSDVAGSPLDSITDPSVQDTSTAAEARTVLHRFDLWERVPDSIRAHLASDQPTPKLPAMPQTVMLADGRSTATAMARAATALGYRTILVPDEREGPAEEVSRALCDEAVAALSAAPAGARGAMLVGCGGESVVQLPTVAAFGAGGPNQQAALVAAQELAGRRAAAVFLDTDGSDGGTAYAGAVVDGATAATARTRGLDLPSALAAHEATAICEALGAAVRTGHTGTNVNDLYVIAVEGGPS